MAQKRSFKEHLRRFCLYVLGLCLILSAIVGAGYWALEHGLQNHNAVVDSLVDITKNRKTGQHEVTFPIGDPIMIESKALGDGHFLLTINQAGSYGCQRILFELFGYTQELEEYGSPKTLKAEGVFDTHRIHEDRFESPDKAQQKKYCTQIADQSVPIELRYWTYPE